VNELQNSNRSTQSKWYATAGNCSEIGGESRSAEKQGKPTEAICVKYLVFLWLDCMKSA